MMNLKNLQFYTAQISKMVAEMTEDEVCALQNDAHTEHAAHFTGLCNKLMEATLDMGIMHDEWKLTTK